MTDKYKLTDEIIKSLKDLSKLEQIRWLIYLGKNIEYRHLIYPLFLEIITNPDELLLFFNEYYSEGKQPLLNQARKAINHILLSFNITSIKQSLEENHKFNLKDVMYITRPKPINAKQIRNMSFIHKY